MVADRREEMNTSTVIKSYRGKLLLTQDAIADKMGISRQMYNSYENDLLHCQLDVVLKILANLNVDDSQIGEFLNALKQDYMSYKADKISKEKE